MLFYKVTGMLTEEETSHDDDRRDSRKRALRFMGMIAEFNEQSEAYSFISNIDELEIICGIAVFEKKDISALAKAFLKYCGIAQAEIESKEITFASWRNLLRVAERNYYVEDFQNILEKLEQCVMI